MKAYEVTQSKHKSWSAAEPAATEDKSLSAKSKLHRQVLALHMSMEEQEAELTLRALNHGNLDAALSRCR